MERLLTIDRTQSNVKEKEVQTVNTVMSSVFWNARVIIRIESMAIILTLFNNDLKNKQLIFNKLGYQLFASLVNSPDLTHCDFTFSRYKKSFGGKTFSSTDEVFTQINAYF